MRRLLVSLALLGTACRDTDEDRCGALTLAVTEVFANPSGADTGHEWIELYNGGTSRVPLGGLSLVAGEKLHVLREVSLEPGDYLVLGGVLDEFRPAHVDYGFGADLGGLANSDGLIELRCEGRVVAAASYAAAPDGASWAVTGASWCEQAATPGLPNGDCEGGPVATDCTPPGPGDLELAEVLANPVGADDDQEWIELRVMADVDLTGLQLGTEAGVKGTIQAATCLAVTAGSYVILAREADPAVNGGLPEVAATFSFALANGASGTVPERELFIAVGDVTLDSVTYTTTTEGSSLARDDDGDWCAAAVPTPGTANADCVGADECTDAGGARPRVAPAVGDLVISELMPAPTGDDAVREWFEVRVTRDVDLNGVALANEGTSQTLGGTACLAATAGSYLVLARSASEELNGGLPEPFATFGFGLANSGARRVALLYDGALLDEVLYGSTGVTVTDGASSMLDDGTWCTATASYGAGGLGTPGQTNECGQQAQP